MNLIDESHGEREEPLPDEEMYNTRDGDFRRGEERGRGEKKKGKKTARAIEGIRETKKSRIGPRSSPQRERSGKKKKKKEEKKMKKGETIRYEGKYERE